MVPIKSIEDDTSKSVSYTSDIATCSGVVPGIFRRVGLTPPKRGLKYDFQGTINAKNLRKNRFSPSDGGLACSDGGL